MTKLKSIFSSWTFWMNIAALLLAILQLPETMALNIIPNEWLVFIVGVLNVILRLKTNTGIKGFSKNDGI